MSIPTIQVQFRRDITAYWTSNNPVLADGEVGIDYNPADDTYSVKIGTGLLDWVSLPYLTQGIAGTDGVGVVSAEISGVTGHLIMTMSDASTIDAGDVIGPTASYAAAALVSKNLAEAAAVQTALDVIATGNDVEATNADVISTNADVVLTHADVVLTHADAVQTALDVIATNADVVLTNADVISTAADTAQTALDAIDTAADVVLTHADVVLTHADATQTALDVIATGADATQTGLDVIATGTDATQTALDAIATAADRVQTGLDAIATAADVVSTGLDAISTATDVVLTHADVVLTHADAAQTALDRIATGANAIDTNADAIATAADRVQTGLDRVATAADRVQTGLDVIAADAAAATAAAIVGNAVMGPASAVADNIATFNLTTGKLIKDSGVAVSAIAGKVSKSGDTISGALILSDHWNWTGGRNTWVPTAGVIQDYIDAATAGDVLILAASTYVVTSTINVNKALTIKGQGLSATKVTSATPNMAVFTLASSSARVSDLYIGHTGTGTTYGVYAGDGLINLQLRNVIAVMGGAGVKYGVWSQSSITISDSEFYPTSSDSNSNGVYLYNDSAATVNISASIQAVRVIATGAANNNRGIVANNNNTSKTITVNSVNNWIYCLASSGITDIAFYSYSTTTNNVTMNDYQSVFNGADSDVLNTSSNTMNLYGSMLVNGTITGTITRKYNMPAATTALSGYLTSTDWNTFNGKAAGTHAATHRQTGTDPTTNNDWHGVVARSTVSPLPTSIASTTFTLAGATTALQYYYKGELVTVSTNKTCTVSAGRNWIYFTNNTGALTVGASFPDLFQNVLVCSVFWNGSLGTVCDERHNHTRDIDWHESTHKGIGTRYISGLDFAFTGTTNTNTTFTITSGQINDEDIQFVVNNPSNQPSGTWTSGRIWYETAANVYTSLGALSTKPYWGGASAGNGIYAINVAGYAQLTITSSTRYFNYFVYGSTDVLNPVYIIAETTATTAGYTSVANARLANPPNLGLSNLTPELKLLYRVVVNGAGLVQTFAVADDYRTGGSIPGGGVTTVSHSSLSNLLEAATGVTYGHITDQAQTIAGAKVFSDGVTSPSLSGTNTGDDKTAITGILKGNGTTISAATNGTDYLKQTATSTTAGNAGAAALPCTPAGFITVNIGGTDYKVPYYPV